VAAGVRGDAGKATGVAVEVSLAAIGLETGGDKVGVRGAAGGAVGCNSASPSIWLGESPRTAECIRKSAPAPTAPMLSSEASIAFVDTAPGRDAPRGLEACSGGSNGYGGSGIERLSRGFGTVQLCSSGWWIIWYPTEHEPGHREPGTSRRERNEVSRCQFVGAARFAMVWRGAAMKLAILGVAACGGSGQSQSKSQSQAAGVDGGTTSLPLAMGGAGAPTGTPCLDLDPEAFSVAYSKDLLLISNPQGASLLRTSDYSVARTFSVHNGSLAGAAMSRDGAHAAVIDTGNEIRLFDPQTAGQAAMASLGPTPH
jgi:hypothetical protein